MFSLNKTIAILLVISVFFNLQLSAKEYKLSPQDNLQATLDNSQNGDVITLGAGKYVGNFIIRKQITLRGSSSIDSKNKMSIIDAQGKGHALWLQNAHITIENLTITNWGNDVTQQHSGIYYHEKIEDDKATNITIQGNLLIGDGYGIYLNHVDKAKIIHNRIKGNSVLNSAERGNGIQIANVTNSHIVQNEVSESRDGIYVTSSQNNLIEQNTMHHLRYGVHYMYSNDDTVKHNTAYNTRAGYALMSSSRLTIVGNKTSDSEDYGLLLNFITQSTLSYNHIERVWSTPEKKALGREGKGLFIYHSANNTLNHNIIDSADIGIHLTAGSENIKIYNNSFINNPIQVKYSSNKEQEWSHAGKGNYWSNYLGWDMNNDGIGDTAFEPNDGIDKLVWQYPEMKMLMDSPAILMLRWVQRQFPVIKPTGIKDSYPLMATPILSISEDALTAMTKPTTHQRQEYRRASLKEAL